MAPAPSDPRQPSIPARETPAPLAVAASVVALQGVALVALAVVTLATVDSDRVSLAIATGAFFVVYGAGLLLAAWSLSRLSGWARGPVLLTQLIELGLAWNVRESPLLAVVLAVMSVVVVLGVIHPASLAALDGPAVDE